MKKNIHYPKLKNYFSTSEEYSKADALIHLEVKNFNLLNGLGFLIALLLLLSILNPLILIMPISLALFILFEYISLYVYCKNLEVERVLKGKRFCEGERLKIQYRFNLPLKFKTILFEDFEGVSPDEQVFKIEGLKRATFEKSYHLNQGFGEFSFRYLNIVLSDSFELFTFKIEFQQQRKIQISPFIQTLLLDEHSALSDAKNIGEYEFIKRGISPIFYGLREYRYGDPFKYINWKASTKTNKILVNEFENIQSLDAVIYVDLNPTHHIGMGVNSSWEYCRDLALSIAQVHSNKSHLLQVLSSDYISENTQASVVVDDLKHYLHFHQKTTCSQGRSAKESLSLIESASCISFILPLGFYNDIVEFFDELIIRNITFAHIDIYLVDAFNVVKNNVSPEFKPRVMSEQKNALDLIQKVKKELLIRGVTLKICTVQEPHNIEKQLKTIK